MLTQKQQDLFRLLEINTDEEGRVRKHYKIVKEGNLTRKPFTAWLEDCLRAKWRRANERIYVGD